MCKVLLALIFFSCFSCTTWMLVKVSRDGVRETKPVRPSQPLARNELECSESNFVESNLNDLAAALHADGSGQLWSSPPAGLDGFAPDKGKSLSFGRRHWKAARHQLIEQIKEHGKLQRLHREGKASQIRSIVYSCEYGGFCGGLADRLEGTIVLYYAALVSNRSFFIDWKKPRSLENFYLPRNDADSFDWRISAIPDAHTKETLLSAEREYLQRRDDTLDCNKLAKMIMDPGGQPVFRLTTNHAKSCVVRLLNRELQYKRVPPDAMGLAFRWLFQESPMLTANVSTFIKENHWNAAKGICLHIRHGGKMGTKNSGQSGIIDPIRHKNLSPFWTCARRAVSNNLSMKAAKLSSAGGQSNARQCQQWLVISDDDALVDLAQQELPAPALVLNTRHLGPVLHVDKLGQYRHSQSPQATQQGEMRVFIDHALLKRCHTLLASHSAFSQSAAGVSTVVRAMYLVDWLRGPRTPNSPPCRLTDPYEYW